MMKRLILVCLVATAVACSSNTTEPTEAQGGKSDSFFDPTTIAYELGEIATESIFEDRSFIGFDFESFPVVLLWPQADEAKSHKVFL